MERGADEAIASALALLESPGMRQLLRQRPLPNGMEVLLGAVSGPTAPRTLQIAEEQGCDPAILCEAARFHAREVLFQSGNDAYRTLGLDADATDEQIRRHHRLLQQWLHPDRLQGSEDSVFAARVNTAWNHLRSAERREEYDRLNPRANVMPDMRVAMRRVAVEEEDGEYRERRWHRHLFALVLIAGCIVLAVIAWRDQGVMPLEDAATGSTTPNQVDALLAQTSRHASQPRIPGAPLQRPVQPQLAAAPQLLPIERRMIERQVSASVGLPQMQAPVTNEQALRPSEPPAPVVASVAADPPPATAPVVSAAPAVVSQNTVVVSVDADQVFARTPEARKVGGQLLHYLSTPDAVPPPIWSNSDALLGAEQLRSRILSRKVKFDVPTWRMREQEARLNAALRVRGDDAALASAQPSLRARLVWRENRWLVADVGMETQ